MRNYPKRSELAKLGKDNQLEIFGPRTHFVITQLRGITLPFTLLYTLFQILSSCVALSEKQAQNSTVLLEEGKTLIRRSVVFLTEDRALTVKTMAARIPVKTVSTISFHQINTFSIDQIISKRQSQVPAFMRWAQLKRPKSKG